MSETKKIDPSAHEQTSKLTKWKNEPTVMMLEDDLIAAKASHSSQVAKVKEWLDLRNVEGKARPKTKANRSKVQPKLIRKQAEWRYSALSEPFLNNDRLFTVKPVTFEDTKAAKQNERVLNHQFRTRMNRVKFIDEYVRTTVDEGTCYVRLGWRRETEKVQVQVPVWKFYEIETLQEMQTLQAAVEAAKADPRTFREQMPLEMQEAVKYFLETRIPTVAEITGYETVQEEKVLVNQPTADFVHYENIFIDPTCEGDIDRAQFIIVSWETSLAELKKDGRYKNLDNINWDDNNPLSIPDHQSNAVDPSFQFKDRARKRVVAYEYWGFYDVDGNDSLTPFVATWIGKTMIRMEENPFPDKKLPFVAVPYLPITRSITGEPDAELLADNQAVLGAMTRGMVDLMGRSAASQTGYAKGFLDPLNKRRMQNGDDYEFNMNIPPASGVHHHTYPEISQSALTITQMQNQEAESLTGVKAFSGGLSGEAYGDVAAGIRGMLDASSKREMGILRRLAMGMKQIGTKIMAMNQVFLTEAEVVRITNEEFVSIDRDDLAGNFDCEVDIATAEVDEAKSQDMAFMLQTLGNSVPFELTQMILTEIAELKRMPTLANRLANYKPQPDPMEQRLKELEIRKLELEIAEIESKAMLNMAKARESGSTADLKDLDFLEQESGTKHLRDLDKLGAQADANKELEITKAKLTPRKKEEQKPDIADAQRYVSATSGLTALV